MDAPTTHVSADALSALRRVLGGDCVLQHDDVSVDGTSLCVTLRPADGESLTAALPVLGELGLSAIVRGGGTQLGLGNPPVRGDVLLSTEGLSTVIEFDADDGVVHAAAGTDIAALSEQVAAAGWELPLEPSRPGATVGGALAVAAAGPRALGLGRARDCVLGLSVALASGERTSCGGRVVKNVTGYDLQKLYTGSLGTLGVILDAWLRLRPAPATQRACCLSLAAEAPGTRAHAFALEASRRPSARAVAWASPEIVSRHEICSGGGAWVLLAEFAGDEASVARDAAWLEASGNAAGLAPVSTAEGVVARLRTAQGEGNVRARIATLASRLEAACSPLLEAGVGLVVHPGLGFIYAISQAARVEPVLAAIDAAVAQGDGEIRIEALPHEAKQGRDMFGAPGPRLALARALKQQFDPAGTLNPGRSQGFI